MHISVLSQLRERSSVPLRRQLGSFLRTPPVCVFLSSLKEVHSTDQLNTFPKEMIQVKCRKLEVTVNRRAQLVASQ